MYKRCKNVVTYVSKKKHHFFFIGSGADKSYCPMPGASAFSDRASEISLGTCPWASDISMSCIESESSFLYVLTNLIFLIVMKTLY